jgi:hypothetical protein
MVYNFCISYFYAGLFTTNSMNRCLPEKLKITAQLVQNVLPFIKLKCSNHKSQLLDPEPDKSNAPHPTPKKSRMGSEEWLSGI